MLITRSRLCININFLNGSHFSSTQWLITLFNKQRFLIAKKVYKQHTLLHAFQLHWWFVQYLNVFTFYENLICLQVKWQLLLKIERKFVEFNFTFNLKTNFTKFTGFKIIISWSERSNLFIVSLITFILLHNKTSQSLLILIGWQWFVL